MLPGPYKFRKSRFGRSPWRSRSGNTRTKPSSIADPGEWYSARSTSAYARPTTAMIPSVHQTPRPPRPRRPRRRSRRDVPPAFVVAGLVVEGPDGEEPAGPVAAEVTAAPDAIDRSLHTRQR